MTSIEIAVIIAILLNIVITVSIGRYLVAGIRELAEVLPVAMSEILADNVPQAIPEDFNPIQMAVAQWISGNLSQASPLKDETGKFVKKLE